ncbi:MAG: hypothetical protein MUE79_04410 [Nitratireductor sp.]|nr:hypothetical protein [Nitratireductor sp.]
MEHNEDDVPVLTPREARQGVRVPTQTLVLVLSLLLALVAGVFLYLWGPGSRIEVPAGGDIPAQTAPD